jgi:uncharacterized protein
MAAFYVCAGLLGLLAVLLTLNVGRARTKKHILLGDGGDSDMAAAIRAHGNLLELPPLCLFLIWLLGFLDFYGGGTVAVLAIVLLVARLAHAGGMLGFIPMGRLVGATVTTGILAVASIWLALAGLGVRLY